MNASLSRNALTRACLAVLALGFSASAFAQVTSSETPEVHGRAPTSGNFDIVLSGGDAIANVGETLTAVYDFVDLDLDPIDQAKTDENTVWLNSNNDELGRGKTYVIKQSDIDAGLLIRFQVELRTNDATTIPFKSDIAYDSVVGGKPPFDPKDPAAGDVNSVTITYANGSAVTQPLIGEQLKANAFCSATDVACTDTGTIEYQWMRDTNGDGNFVDIAGQTSQTYTLVSNPSTGGDQKDRIKVRAVRQTP